MTHDQPPPSRRKEAPSATETVLMTLTLLALAATVLATIYGH